MTMNGNSAPPLLRRLSSSSSSSWCNGGSHIPVPKYSSSLTSVRLSSPEGDSQRWKTKYEEAEAKRKLLFSEVQKNARENSNLNKKYEKLLSDHNALKRELQAKEDHVNTLRKGSEALVSEFEKLKRKYEVETGAMYDAMKTATQWYKENRKLKRKSEVLVQKYLQMTPIGSVDIMDETDTSDVTSKDEDGLDCLHTKVKELSQEVGALQADLKSARLLEFEAQEQVANLTIELDEERKIRKKVEQELEELRSMKSNMENVTRLVAAEMLDLREQCDKERQNAQLMKIEANKAQKERNVLAHQSTLLLCEISDNEKLMKLLQEVDTLKSQLEEERQIHIHQLQELQEKLEDTVADAQLELMEERLKLAESELQCALQRAERAESEKSLLSSKVSGLESELQALKCPPPPPPPPLPPPPPPMAGAPILRSKVRRESIETDSSPVNPVREMANILGVPRRPPSKVIAAQAGAIDDIINQIKGGRFTLKTIEKQTVKKEEPPPAVQEMLNVLGTLRRRPRNRPANSQPPPDVAL